MGAVCFELMRHLEECSRRTMRVISRLFEAFLITGGRNRNEGAQDVRKGPHSPINIEG